VAKHSQTLAIGTQSLLVEHLGRFAKESSHIVPFGHTLDHPNWFVGGQAAPESKMGIRLSFIQYFVKNQSFFLLVFRYLFCLPHN